ncbi:hypothetical protein MHK_006531 [Candidatus Magnetomorum sp. HK-1]|nr:hypothetical protein MHK_006531 [Candidatus Magnetomorum sp. HK-1]
MKKKKNIVDKERIHQFINEIINEIIVIKLELKDDNRIDAKDGIIKKLEDTVNTKKDKIINELSIKDNTDDFLIPILYLLSSQIIIESKVTEWSIEHFKYKHQMATDQFKELVNNIHEQKDGHPLFNRIQKNSILEFLFVTLMTGVEKDHKKVREYIYNYLIKNNILDDKITKFSTCEVKDDKSYTDLNFVLDSKHLLFMSLFLFFMGLLISYYSWKELTESVAAISLGLG